MISRIMAKRLVLRDHDRGAVFVEFALAVPLMLLLAMGIVEYGIGWKAANDVNATTRDAARSATSATAYVTADRTALVTIGGALSTAQLDNIQKVIVFRSDATGTIDPDCLSTTPNSGGAGVSGECNVYSGAQAKWVFNNPTDDNNLGSHETWCDSSQWDRFWCPSDRNHSVASGSLDYLGVYIDLKHESLTNFGFGDLDITKKSVFRLEPKFGIN